MTQNSNSRNSKDIVVHVFKDIDTGIFNTILFYSSEKLTLPTGSLTEEIKYNTVRLHCVIPCDN